MAEVTTGTQVYGEPGYIVVEIDGKKTQYSIANILRAADIPTGLTHTQVPSVATLTDLVVILIRTLINKKVLDESFLEDGELELADIKYFIEQLGGNYDDPDMSGET